jgi:hypothetical protein
MKKIYATLGVVLIGTTAMFAQKQSVNLGRVDFDHFNLGSRTPTDTLWPGDFENGSPSLYGSQNGGYVVGNNGYGDQGKGQVFITNATIVEGAAFFFGGKSDGGNGSNVVAELRALDGTTGTTTAGQGDQACPGTLLGSANIALSDVDTSGMFNFVSFTPASVNSDFYIGFNVAGFAAGDTIGLVSSADGEGGQAELAWEQWDNGAWYSMLAAWPLDFDLAIWAIVDNASTGIEGDNFFNGVKADVMPNPASEVANIVFDLEEMRNIDVQVIDLNGKLVYSADKGELAKGRHKITFSVEGWAEGTYFYSIGNGNSRLTKKLVVKN